ncbi:glutamine synthetase III [Cytophagaceae bacterium DM2B3-1]|uniref:Glutamine synthetase III n=1 Tax=Xanthocytophaga flava TaxID=3048013 RepID=A0ABT7CI13_9BACT|nr:glutamine synthetase III [Xanthocytophaga flavus]MDJ1468473.1 glutamine synthetase III [Xanthocytophaga flavus]MDJ1493368.1 glutamine synthetase III [Xanthocytophaga flavus]
MANLRFKAVDQAQSRITPEVTAPSVKVSDYYGCNVFGMDAMRQHLSAEAFKKVSYAIKTGSKIDEDLADVVASAMKTWAMSKGVTHYTHWFQPLTGSTAEKHDAFFDVQSDGSVLEKFKGSALVQQEPDASSFPNGGIRSTFEARGYTAWDPTSPAFIVDQTLCIPTVFVSYTGEALDYKAPLLKALAAVDKAAVDVCQYFDRDVTRVVATLGPEQEYFLVDRALFMNRPDLIMTGRTVFGHSPAKGQQLEDHYFGTIPQRVEAYMRDFEIECYKLGIPVRTRHNEVAPGQFECAPTFEEVNLAVDHNLLVMDIMDKVADRHNFKVLFHEKPFAGINGSGKHNNWSLGTNTGVNLLGPSSRPKENLRFLTFFVNVVKAVHDYSDLLRASIGSSGNEHRLGANEAPPAIVSIFIGSQMASVLDELDKKGNVKLDKGENMYMKLGIDKIPPILLDNTDRNRTSPFAFTGNKFEFRAVGGSANCANAMTVLNTIMAETLIQFKKEVDALITKGEKKEVAIVNVLRKYIKASKTILFEGNGYSDEWKKEAEKRGLKNVASTPEALDFYVEKKAIQVFEKNNVMNEREIHARHEIMLENYIKKIQIESRVMGDLVLNHIVPTAVKYQNVLVGNVQGLKSVGIKGKYTENTVATIEKIAEYVDGLLADVEEMTEARKKANNTEDVRERAILYNKEVKGFFDKIRYAVDKLELLVDDEDWPLVKYRELLLIK